MFLCDGWMSLTVPRDPRRWGLKHIDHTVCARRCDRQRLVFHGHFVCLCTIMHAYISEAAQGQSQMKLISINPFQIRRADGKRTAFKRPWCSPHLPCRHDYLLSCDAASEWIMFAVPLKVNYSNLPKQRSEKQQLAWTGWNIQRSWKEKKYQRIIKTMWMVPLKELIYKTYINTF